MTCDAGVPLLPLTQYQFINAAAVAIKAADPRHPVGTVTTSPTEAIASCLNEHCPAIEVWGVNVYGSMLERLPAKMREIGFTRAYCVTEYGPQNWWQARRRSALSPLLY